MNGVCCWSMMTWQCCLTLKAVLELNHFGRGNGDVRSEAREKLETREYEW